MTDQLDRIEGKLDLLLEARHEHHGRLTKLEAQAGFVKWLVAAVGSITAVLVKLASDLYTKLHH